MNIDDILIIDDFLPQKEQKLFLDFFSSSEISWFFQKSISSYKEHSYKYQCLDNNIEDAPAFAFFIKKQETVIPGFEFAVEAIGKNLLDRSIRVEQVLRCRALLMFPTNKKAGSYNIPHVDFPMQHTTLIYYVNDSDGETFFFNEIADGSNEYTKKTLIKKVEPKMGRAIIFNGLRYHTGTTPTNNFRILLNYNFI